jgi:hypothetical protein
MTELARCGLLAAYAGFALYGMWYLVVICGA